MKKRMSKSLISVLLCIAMIASMIACGIVQASSAEVEVAAQGADFKEIYFTNNYKWSSVKIHYWGGATSSEWPGIDMSKLYTNSTSEDVYYVKIPADSTKIIFNNGSGIQTVDTAVSKAVEAFYLNGWDNGKAVATAWPTPPAAEAEYTVYLADNTNGKWVSDNDAVLTVNDVTMKKSVDEHTGWTVWYAKIKTVENASLTFKRLSKIKLDGEYKVWNTWTTSFDKDKPCTVLTTDKNDSDITNANTGAAATIPAGTATDFWYGIWADTKGNGDTKDFVKIYASDYYGSTKYYLYLPSYVDLTQVTIYTSLYNLTIGSQSVARATATKVNLSESVYNLSYKRYENGSTHSDFKLHVMKTTGVSAMLMTTNDELYTGLTAAYGDNGDGTANYEGVAAYKATVSTKGDYVFYDASGKCQNPTDKTTGNVLTGLKKIKARGNSTFEASMRLYGKTAYNITLNDKVKLIDGAEAAKKYSLLANNADETLMRNVTVYAIADAIGMPYTPNTRLIDLYDNGNYLGAYVLTEKVEYGKNTLINKVGDKDVQSLDKFNEDILAAGKGIDYDGLKQKTATYTTTKGNTYTYQYSYNPDTSGPAYEFDGTKVTIGEGEEAKEYTLTEDLMKTYDFVLEHELETRYAAEATWFISERTGQAVVPKYPEFATQKEVQWMIEQYDALEDAVFDGDYTRFNEVADVQSFARVYLIQELTMNLDACATSYNITGGGSFGKLLAAPLWDYDWAAGQYNGEKLTTDGKVDVADYSKVFVKNKSVKTDENDSNLDNIRTQSTPNLQAKMTRMDDFWTQCKISWTNDFVPVLKDFLGDGKTLLGTQLPAFRSAAAMNESRWNVLHKMNENPGDYWGTRSTTQYKKGSYNFAIGGDKCTGVTFDYDNTVYYLNDWLTKRRDYMSSATGMALYDANLITPDPTEPPTEAPTTAPTEAPTTAPTDAAETYVLGDTDGNGQVTILDATHIQRILVELAQADEKTKIRGDVNDNGLDILDATYIQRYLVEYPNTYDIGSVKSYPTA